jgi:purine-nucleoside phosphorylase
VSELTFDQIQESVAAVRSRMKGCPQVGLILGSGLNGLIESIQGAEQWSYRDLPHFVPTTVEGHAGRLVAGDLEGQAVMVMQGRVHYYEGHALDRITLPVRVLQWLGIKTLVVTNAAGGLNPAFQVGDLMIISDHLNLLGMTGQSPLRGPNDTRLGPRFPDMSEAYDRSLRRLAVQVASEAEIRVHEGIYVGLGGPNFETPAELRFLRMIGADAVGMSTVPEVIVARHGGLRVLGLSGISNMANLQVVTSPNTHQEVLQAGREIVPKLTRLLRGILRTLPPVPDDPAARP